MALDVKQEAAYIMETSGCHVVQHTIDVHVNTMNVLPKAKSIEHLIG